MWSDCSADLERVRPRERKRERETETETQKLYTLKISEGPIKQERKAAIDNVSESSWTHHMACTDTGLKTCTLVSVETLKPLGHERETGGGPDERGHRKHVWQ